MLLNKFFYQFSQNSVDAAAKATPDSNPTENNSDEKVGVSHFFLSLSILQSLSSYLNLPVTIIQSPSSNIYHPISIVQSPSSSLYHPIYQPISIIQSPSSNLTNELEVLFNYDFLAMMCTQIHLKFWRFVLKNHSSPFHYLPDKISA